MNTVIFLVFVAVLVDSAILLPTRVKRWSVQRTLVEPAPGLSPGDLTEVLATSPDIRYSDRLKHLTALKNSKFKACFIIDLDPDFHLMEAEMDKITTERVPEMADTPPRYYAFLKKTGPFLTAMCRQMDIYWLNAVAPPLPPDSQPISELPVPGKDTPLPVNHRPPTPPPLYPNPPNPYFAHQDPPTPLPVRHDPPTPPPVEIYHKEESHKDVLTPPPVNLYHVQLANQNANQDEGQDKTPPPILQLANQKAHQDDRQLRTPPPLALWKLQQGK